jgi:GNAT superfamily N-acetyltransferase
LQTAALRHSHADWHLPADWLGTPGFVVCSGGPVETNHDLLACLAVAADPPPAAWVRLAAVRSSERPEHLLTAMLDRVTPYLISGGVTELGWMVVEPWPESVFSDLGFRQANWITTYVLDRFEEPAQGSGDIVLRPAESAEMAALAKMEAEAFEPLWRHSTIGLELGFRQSLSFDVAVIEGRVTGFQYSVRGHSRGTAHLVRITVNPADQGRGVGGALMARAIEGYRAAGIERVTLNTQVNNFASQRLYERFGFRCLGDQLPVWVLGVGSQGLGAGDR